MAVDTREDRRIARRIRRWALRALAVGIVLLVAGWWVAQTAFLWSFTSMDNPPPDPLYVPLWNVGVGCVVVGAILATGGCTVWVVTTVVERFRRRGGSRGA